MNLLDIKLIYAPRLKTFHLVSSRQKQRFKDLLNRYEPTRSSRKLNDPIDMNKQKVRELKYKKREN